jgi:hypothetical protein
LGQTNVPVGLSNVIAIAANGSHSSALKNDGTIEVWGDYSCGQTNVPVWLTNVVSVAGQTGRGMAITAGLRILSLEQVGSNARLRFHGFAGRQYAVEYSPDLAPGDWFDLPGGMVSGSGWDALVTDPDAFSNEVSRFYRVRETPSP